MLINHEKVAFEMKMAKKYEKIGSIELTTKK